MIEIEQLKGIRALFRKFADKNDDLLLETPTGFRNNILWNVGHVVVTQQLLHYKLSGLPMMVDDATVEMFQKGSSPERWEELPDLARIKEQLTAFPEMLAEDYESGRFEKFRPYVTSAGIPLKSVDEAIKFNNFHEGIHLGYAMAMLRALRGEVADL